ncbi:MAG: peptidoglycan-binding protein, partial [Demequina sp.]
MNTSQRPRGATRGIWLWALALVVSAGLGALFGVWAFGTPQVAVATDTPATVDVTQMTVGQSVPLAVSGVWDSGEFGVGAGSGVLTSIDVADNTEVSAGDVLYTVDLRPVVAAKGTVPAFRDLSRGDSGEDVAQIQRMLNDGGFLDAPADGEFGPATSRAVREWQKTLGVDDDGVVRASDVVFAAALPARVQVINETGVGDRLSAGDSVLTVLNGEPEFIATIPSGTSVDSSLPIEIIFGDEPVMAEVVNWREDQSGNMMLSLARPDGSPVCADRCADVSLNQADAVYAARQIVIPEVTGLGVPAAAIWFTPAGEPYLVLPDETEMLVTILGQGQGSVVLDGV